MDAITANYGNGASVPAQATLTRVVNPTAAGSNVLADPEAEMGIAVDQNPNLAADVNADGQVTPLDVLLVINEVNAGNAESNDTIPGEGETLAGEGEVDTVTSPPFYDVNGDRVVSSLDVLSVIAALNAVESNVHAAAAEGEATGTILVTRLGFVTHLPQVSALQEPAEPARQYVPRLEPGNEERRGEVSEVPSSLRSESRRPHTTSLSEPFELDDLIDLLAEDVDAAQDQLAVVG